MKRTCLVVAILLASLALAQPQFPPPRPDPVPSFQIPEPGRALDEGWQYAQTLVDAQLTHPELFNAYPVQIAFTHNGRGAIATLHTFFRTFDGGHTWVNLDPTPPPSNTGFTSLRIPVYITGIVARPLAVTDIALDTLLFCTQNVTTNFGRVRMLSYLGNDYFLQPDTIRYLEEPHWLTGLAIPDSDHIFAFAGFDRLVYHRDSLSRPVFTAWDSLYATTSDQWVAGPVASAESLMVAVGGERWISRDAGATWSAEPPADAQSDYGVSFADELHGLTGGGTLQPSPTGWVHRTTNGGLTWSERVLQTSVPIRCVKMVTAQIGFAAGGNYNESAGEIWKTTDGGDTWTQDATMDAEITAIESERASGAYVNVIAAGVFPDFRGGVWMNRLYMPDPSGPVLVADPDTLDFGVVAPGESVTLPFTVQNVGSDTGFFSESSSSNLRFVLMEPLAGTKLAPQQAETLHVKYEVLPQDSSGIYSATVALISDDGRTEITGYGTVPLSAGEPLRSPLPEIAMLSAWPNPGNSSFEIRYALSHAADVNVKVFDVQGREAAVLHRTRDEVGEHVLSWNAAEFASGIYFVRVETLSATLTTKLLLVK